MVHECTRVRKCLCNHYWALALLLVVAICLKYGSVVAASGGFVGSDQRKSINSI